jgi:hypothetical protein
MSLPVPSRAARRRLPSPKEPRMTRTRPRRLATLLAAAGAVAVLMAGVALGSARGGADREQTAETSAFRLTMPDVIRTGLDRLPDVTWRSDDNDVITVAGKSCPRSHPHKIGSSSSSSWTDVNGRLTNRSRRRAICER